MNLGGIFSNINIGYMLGGIAGAVFAPFAWKMANYIWEYFKPLHEFTDFAKEKAYEAGRAQRKFFDKRLKDETFKNKVINDICESSEQIQDQYVIGLKGL